MEAELIRRRTSLMENLIGFVRFLRTKGYPLGPEEEKDALQAMAMCAAKDQEEFMFILRSVMAKDRRQWRKFEELFQEYWFNFERAINSKKKDVPENVLRRNQKTATLSELKNWLYGNKPETGREESLAAYSSFEHIARKDFGGYTDQDVERIKQILRLLERSVASKKRRRYRSTRHREKLDLRKTIRQNIRQGTEIINLAYRSRQQERTRLLVLCDVSKSMDLYSQFLVQFLYAFQHVFRSIETFIFSSSIQRITPYLKDLEFDEALELLGEEVRGWSGGTRIGASLDTLITSYAPLVNSHTHILVLSDGWDDGNLDLLKESMQWLHRKAGRIIWLNPLMANPDFAPETGGMKTALPFIDVLHPCHNLDSLRDLVKRL